MKNSNQSLITEKEFELEWGVMTREDGNLFQYCDVCDKPLNRVWSIVESGDEEDGNWYALPGFHVVNHLGYVMTRKPWSDKTLDAIYFLDDF